MFIINNNIRIYNNKIITLQNNSTPGVYKIFRVEPNKKYTIELEGYDNKLNNTKLWIADIYNRKIYFQNIVSSSIEYQNTIFKRIKIGVLFSGRFNIYSYFQLDDINMYYDDDEYITQQLSEKQSLIKPIIKTDKKEFSTKEIKSEIKVEFSKEIKDITKLEKNSKLKKNTELEKKKKEKLNLDKSKKEISMTNNALVTYGVVIQIFTSSSIKYFDSFARRKYKLIHYYNTKLPAIFYGCYNDTDIYKIKNHQGPKVLIWGGSDIIRKRIKTYVSKIKDLRHIAQSSFIINDLKKIKKPCMYLPFAPTVNYQEYSPVKKGKYVYVYTNASNHEFYGSKIYLRLMRQIPNIKFIVTSNSASLADAVRRGINCNYIQTFRQSQMYDVYKKCFIGLRLTKHDGISATVQELGMMGIKCVHNGNSPSSINYKDYKDVMNIILEESQNIGKVDIKTSNKTRKHLEMCDELLPYLFKTIEINGEFYVMQDNNLWYGQETYIKRKTSKWIIYPLEKKRVHLYENSNMESYIPPKDGWIKVEHEKNKNVVKITNICVIIYTYNNPYSLQKLLNTLKDNNKNIDVYIYDDCSAIDQLYDDKNYGFNIKYYKFEKYHGLLNAVSLYNHILKDFKYKDYEYYYLINDNAILLDNFFDLSINQYIEINDVNKIILNLRNNGLKRVWWKFNPIRYNKNLWLNNWIEMGCFMFQKNFFEELKYELAQCYDINKYLTQNFNKLNKHIYIVDKTLAILENRQIT